jgi:nitroreductase
MIDDTLSKEILSAGNAAPSGENCQPWRFSVSGHSIEVWIDPDKDRSIYNWGQRASYMAAGAALENMRIRAAGKGYQAHVAYFPDADTTHVATIAVREDSTLDDPLDGAIEKRCTNRKPYEKSSLSAKTCQLLTEVVKEENCELRLISDQSEIETLGRIGAVNEEVMLTEKKIHDFFFSHINWTLEEEEKKRTGFFIDTLELPPPARFIFKLLANWPLARILTSLGIQKMVASENGKTNSCAGAMGALICKGTQPIDFVRAGRAMQRLWLTATMENLSVQPLTGVLFFMLSLENDPQAHFSDSNSARIREAYKEIVRIFDAGDRSVFFMFRIGKAEPPTARSSRLPLAMTSN